MGGAVAIYVLLELGSLPFFWTPLIVGLAYLAAAGSAGPRGSYWATGVVITGWGLGVVALGEGWIDDVSTASGYLVAAGAGALVAAGLARAGYAIDLLGVAASVFAAGLFFALADRIDALVEPTTYAAALALVGLVRLAAPERGQARRR
jgi:hypothetical protein